MTSLFNFFQHLNDQISINQISRVYILTIRPMNQQLDQSNCSSFKDHYQQYTSNSSIVIRQYEILKKSEYLYKLCEIIGSSNFWSQFVAFQKIRKNNHQHQNIIIRQKLMGKIIAKYWIHLTSDLSKKNKALQQFFRILQSNRNQQLTQNVSIMHLRNRQLLNKSFFFRKLCLIASKNLDFNKRLQLSPQSTKKNYLQLIKKNKKLKVTCACKLIRSIGLRGLKRYYQTIKFHKTNGGKILKIRQNKITKRHCAIILLTLNINRMTITVKKWFWRQTLSNFISDKGAERKDHPQVMTNILQHLCYLSGKISNATKNKANQQSSKIKSVKCLEKFLTKREQLKNRSILYQWRRRNIQFKLKLSDQIDHLERTKEHYLTNYS